MLIIVTNIIRKKIWPSSVLMGGGGPPIAPGLSVNIETLSVEVP